jgi:hypothetical protein
MIKVIQNPKLPQFRFEWHPETKKVWWLEIPKEGKIAQAYVLAEHVDNEALAFGFVQSWCRGYYRGSTGVAAPGLSNETR